MTCKTSHIVAFNQINRDRWVARVAEGLEPGTKVVDVGAGECRYRQLFAHCEYRTQDFCQYEGSKKGMLKDDWKYGQIDYVSDVLCIPVPDSSFDAVLCTEVLEHVPMPIRALSELNRILKVDGHLFLSAPLGSGLHQQPYHHYGGFTPHFYRKFLPECGFSVVSIEPNGGFFRHLLQEVSRAAGVIQSRRRYGRWHPIFWILRYGFGYVIPIWFSRLDDEIFIEEFTVGYHVEARKIGKPSMVG